MADSRAVPRSVRDFIAAMRMPNLRPVSSPRTTQTGVIEPGDLSPAPRRPDSTDYTVLALRLLKREEALTGSKARIHFVPDSTMLKSLSEAFDAIDVLPTIGEHDSVSDEEKALLAKLTLCYNETRAAAPEEPLFYELHQQAMHLLGFIRVLNRVFWHYGGAHEYEAHLVISSPSELNTDFKLCIRPRTPDASRRPTDSRLFVSKEPPKDTIFIIELKREEVAGGDRMQTVLRQMTGENREDKGIVVEVAEGGNSLVWSTLDDGEKTEIGSINGMHLALLQVRCARLCDVQRPDRCPSGFLPESPVSFALDIRPCGNPLYHLQAGQPIHHGGVGDKPVRQRAQRQIPQSAQVGDRTRF